MFRQVTMTLHDEGCPELANVASSMKPNAGRAVGGSLCVSLKFWWCNAAVLLAAAETALVRMRSSTFENSLSPLEASRRRSLQAHHSNSMILSRSLRQQTALRAANVSIVRYHHSSGIRQNTALTTKLAETSATPSDTTAAIATPSTTVDARSNIQKRWNRRGHVPRRV